MTRECILGLDAADQLCPEFQDLLEEPRTISFLSQYEIINPS